MSASNFKIEEHVIPSQHIRQYPRATVNIDEDELELAIKQYTPLDNLDPQPGDITIIAAHANGIPKELYEPLWDDLHALSNRSGDFKIRSIWIADAAWQGESGVRNEDKLGLDPSWFDHSRDLLHMVNVFRKQMIPPIIGWGHSLGGANVVQLSLMHPRLFAGLVLYEPVIQRVPSCKGNYMPAYLSTFRRDAWPTRDLAAGQLRTRGLYKDWDQRCFEKLVKYGFRSLPTALFSEYVARPVKNGKTPEPEPTDPVTLTTSKHHEVFTFLRPNFPCTISEEAMKEHSPSRRTHPDLNKDIQEVPFYRPEPFLIYEDLPRLRPRCIYMFGETSPLSDPEAISDKLNHTGIGVGGNGGKENDGAVTGIVMEKRGHFFPFEEPKESIEKTGQWLGEELKRWRADQEVERREWEAVKKQRGGQGGNTMSNEFMEWMGWHAEHQGLIPGKNKM